MATQSEPTHIELRSNHFKAANNHFTDRLRGDNTHNDRREYNALLSAQEQITIPEEQRSAQHIYAHEILEVDSHNKDHFLEQLEDTYDTGHLALICRAFETILLNQNDDAQRQRLFKTLEEWNKKDPQIAQHLSDVIAVRLGQESEKEEKSETIDEFSSDITPARRNKILEGQTALANLISLHLNEFESASPVLFSQLSGDALIGLVEKQFDQGPYNVEGNLDRVILFWDALLRKNASFDFEECKELFGKTKKDLIGIKKDVAKEEDKKDIFAKIGMLSFLHCPDVHIDDRYAAFIANTPIILRSLKYVAQDKLEKMAQEYPQGKEEFYRQQVEAWVDALANTSAGTEGEESQKRQHDFLAGLLAITYSLYLENPLTLYEQNFNDKVKNDDIAQEIFSRITDDVVRRRVLRFFLGYLSASQQYIFLRKNSGWLKGPDYIAMLSVLCKKDPMSGCDKSGLVETNTFKDTISSLINDAFDDPTFRQASDYEEYTRALLNDPVIGSRVVFNHDLKDISRAQADPAYLFAMLHNPDLAKSLSDSDVFSESQKQLIECANLLHQAVDKAIVFPGRSKKRPIIEKIVDALNDNPDAETLQISVRGKSYDLHRESVLALIRFDTRYTKYFEEAIAEPSTLMKCFGRAPTLESLIPNEGWSSLFDKDQAGKYVIQDPASFASELLSIVPSEGHLHTPRESEPSNTDRKDQELAVDVENDDTRVLSPLSSQQPEESETVVGEEKSLGAISNQDRESVISETQRQLTDAQSVDGLEQDDSVQELSGS
ncbi:MAG: hypothetical protein ACE365_06265, partial [Gammaproteobacteria bacterium]